MLRRKLEARLLTKVPEISSSVELLLDRNFFE